MMQHGLYPSTVMHRRFVPKAHGFRYKVFSLLLDLDDLKSADRAGGRVFGVNRWAPMSFHDKDHGAGDGRPASDWARALLASLETDWDGASLQLLCFPRMWGYVFNPLAIYYALNEDGGLAAVIYQVSNTFGERHSYVLSSDGTEIARHGIAKGFHVSPFMAMDQRYAFRLKAPGSVLSTIINEYAGDERTLIATQKGKRLAFNKANLAKLMVRHPLMTMKVMAAIHYEALHLWRKGMPYFKKPAPPESLATYGGAAATNAGTSKHIKGPEEPASGLTGAKTRTSIA